MWMELVLAAGLAAQADGASAPTLTFENARKKARDNYPAMVSARLGTQAARLRSRSAGAWDDPMVGLSLWNMPLNNVEDALLPGMTWRQRATTVAMGPEMIPVMAMVSQTFPWPGKRGARANEATAAAEEAAAQVEVTQADLDRALIYAFSELHAAREGAVNIRSTMAVLDTIIEITDGRMATGVGRQQDALSARGERETLEQVLIDLAQQEDLARARLAVLVGEMDPARVDRVASRLVPAAIPPRATLLEAAFHARPELKAARAQVNAALARARGEQLSILPDVTLNASYMANVGGPGMIMQHGVYHTLLGEPDMVTFGVSVPLPVFGPWKQLRNAEAADVEARRARSNVEALLRVVQSEVDEALAGISNAQKHISLHGEKLIPVSERSVEVARAGYASGNADLLVLLSSVRQLRAHHLDRINSALLYARRLADLQRATGLELAHFEQQGGAP